MAYYDAMQRMNRLAHQIDRAMANAFPSVHDEPLLGTSPFDMITDLDRHLSRDPFFGPLYGQQQLLGQEPSQRMLQSGNNSKNSKQQTSTALSTQQPQDVSLFGGSGLMQMPTMKCDVHEDAEKYEVSAELPGVPKESIQLDINDGALTIRAEKKHEHSEFDTGDAAKDKKSDDSHRRVRRYERSYGSVERRFVLPDDVQQDKIAAKYENGVLRVTLPRVSQTKKPAGRRLEIQ
jgi:HSP20 family protein